MIFTSQYYFDAVVPRKSFVFNQQTWPHFLKALKLLRERLADNDNQDRLSNSTIAAVMGLAGYAHLTGDSRSARHHMEGMLKTISLRGV